jgi:DNA-binding NtrC family response regulator
MKTILCASECLYELYELVLLLKLSGYGVVLAMSTDRATVVAASEQIDAVVISALRNGAKSVAAVPIKAVRPDIPILLVTNLPVSGGLPPGVDAIADLGYDQVPRLLEQIFVTVH